MFVLVRATHNAVQKDIFQQEKFSNCELKVLHIENKKQLNYAFTN